MIRALTVSLSVPPALASIAAPVVGQVRVEGFRVTRVTGSFK